MQKRERFRLFIDYFLNQFPEPSTELNYGDSFQLLVSVILSAQCTDKRVNLVTPALFERFPDAESMAAAGFDDVIPYIKSVSYPNNKTRHLLGMAKMLVEKFGTRVPAEVSDLLKLPGVGRKTAHVVASVVYRQPVMAVDTHVFRVSKRIGLVPENARTPLAVEKGLTQFIPRSLIHNAHHWLILHGRYICVARKPKCPACGLHDFCLYYRKYATPAAHVRN